MKKPYFILFRKLYDDILNNYYQYGDEDEWDWKNRENAVRFKTIQDAITALSNAIKDRELSGWFHHEDQYGIERIEPDFEEEQEVYGDWSNC